MIIKYLDIHMYIIFKQKIGSSAICDRYQYETQLLNEISKLQNLYMDQLDVFQYVEDHSGEYFNSNDIYSAYDSIWNIYDCLFIQVRSIVFLFLKNKRQYLNF